MSDEDWISAYNINTRLRIYESHIFDIYFKYQYNINQINDENREKYQFGDN